MQDQLQGMADGGPENDGPKMGGKWKTGKCRTRHMKDHLRFGGHVRMHNECKQFVSL